VYCARGEMENRIKEQQLCLFADRTSCATMRANQLRLWLSSVAYTLLMALRQFGLEGTEMAQARCDTIRLKLLKLGALVRTTVSSGVDFVVGELPISTGVCTGVREPATVVIAAAGLGIRVPGPPSGRFQKTGSLTFCAARISAVRTGPPSPPMAAAGGRQPPIYPSSVPRRPPTASAAATPPHGEKCGLAYREGGVRWTGHSSNVSSTKAKVKRSISRRNNTASPRLRTTKNLSCSKDVLGFANAWRRSEAYILIGVQDVRGSRSDVIGIAETDHLMTTRCSSL